MDNSFLDNKKIISFIERLKIEDERKRKLIEKVPSLKDEEKVFLWKTLLDIYRIDKEEERDISKAKEYFKK